MQPIIFFGSDQYSAIVLDSLLQAKNYTIAAVITDRAKPKGKEQIIEATPVEKIAKAHNFKAFYYPDFNHSLITKNTHGLCASFDHLLPSEIISLFEGNLFNLHPSLLPQYRNVSPVQYALALGDKETGITLFRISSGIDNGEIIAQTKETIGDTDTTSTLTPRLFKLGAELFINGSVEKISQPPQKLVFTHRLTRDSGFIEWENLLSLIADKELLAIPTKNELLNLRYAHNPASGLKMLYDLNRALYPWPGLWSLAQTKKGELRISLETVKPEITIKLAGKPKAISYNDFIKYYL